MPKRALVAVAAGLFSAVMSAILLTGSPIALFIAYFTQLPIYLIGLSLGIGEGIVTAGTATIAVLLAGGGVETAFSFLFVHAIPSLALIRQNLLNRSDASGRIQWYPPGPLVAGLAAYAALIFVAVVVLFAGHEGGLTGMLYEPIEKQLNVLLPHESANVRQELANMTVAILPGMVAASWLVMVAVNAVVAQGLLVRAGKNIRPSPKYTDLAIPRWTMSALAASAALWLIGGESMGLIGQTLTIIFGIPFAFQGVAMVHGFVRALPSGGALLFVCYFLLFISGGWLMLVAALLGLVGQWVKLPQRGGGEDKEKD